MEECKYTLNKLLIDESLQGIPLLVFLNKQDMVNALPVHSLVSQLGLNDVKDRKWFAQATSATTGEGLYEGLEWLSRALTSK